LGAGDRFTKSPASHFKQMKPIRSIILTVLVGLTLSACETTTNQPQSDVAGIASIGPTPAQSQEAVESFIHTRFRDPYSVQELSIAPAFFNSKATVHKDWVIAFTCNAKNGLGGYTGIQRYYVLWKNGSIDWEAIDDPGRAFWRGMMEGAGGSVTM
jgi:hypothetical protein